MTSSSHGTPTAGPGPAGGDAATAVRLPPPVVSAVDADVAVDMARVDVDGVDGVGVVVADMRCPPMPFGRERG